MIKLKYRLSGCLLYALRKLKLKKTFVSAVILAAGSGSRMQSDITKQWIMLDGKPVFVHSLLAFQNCGKVKEIILCVKREELALYDGVAERYGISKLKAVIAGGPTRSDSALRGFKKISDKSTHVAVHDAARCLVTPEMITKVLRRALTFGAAVACCKSTDTVKICDSNGFVSSTPERSSVFLAQTPQIFETEIYRASAYTAIKESLVVTDDSGMAENAGFAVKAVDCGKENLKITEPVDLIFAEAILDMRKKQSENDKKSAQK